MLAHRLRAGRQKETPAQQLADAFDAEAGVLLLEFDDLLRDGSRQLRTALAGSDLKTGFPELLILPDPVVQATDGHAHLDADILHAEPFFEPQPDGFEFFVRRITSRFFRAASPPRGAVPLLLYYGLLFHVNTPAIIGVSTTSCLKSVSRSGC